MFDAEDQGLVQMCNKSRHRQAEDLSRSFLKTADSTILGCNQENCFLFFSFEQECKRIKIGVMETGFSCFVFF